MASVRFSHPRIRPDLLISVNPDQVTWDYGLNTKSYPTFGGEVVQILSVFFGDMTIAGTVSTVAELERIYMWFIRYMQDATQGRYGPSYDQLPVEFYYDERDWHFQIWPKALPAFKYGRDVVAPTWTVVAAVKEPDATFANQVKDLATFNAMHKGQFDTFGKTTADFAATGDLVTNPWASPDADPSNKGQTMSAYTSKIVGKLADTFSGFVQDYTSDSLSQLPQFQNISKAAQSIAQGAADGTTVKTAAKGS